MALPAMFIRHTTLATLPLLNYIEFKQARIETPQTKRHAGHSPSPTPRLHGTGDPN